MTPAHCTLPVRLPLRRSSLALRLSLTPPPSGSLSRAMSSYVCILASAHVCIFRQAWTPRRSICGLVGGNTVILDHVPARRDQDSHPVVRLPPSLPPLPFPSSQLACAPCKHVTLCSTWYQPWYQLAMNLGLCAVVAVLLSYCCLAVLLWQCCCHSVVTVPAVCRCQVP